MNNLDERAKSYRWLEQLQKAAYIADLGCAPPIFSADSLRRRATANAENLRGGGPMEAELIQAGGEPAWVRSVMKEIARGNAQVAAHLDVERVLIEYGDAPTPHVDPFQHALLKRVHAEIEALPRRFPDLSFGEALKHLWGRVTVSTLPTGQMNARSLNVPGTDQLLILFDPAFFELLFLLGNNFAQFIDADKMRQEAMRCMATRQRRLPSKSIRYSEYPTVAGAFAWTLTNFLRLGSPPPALPYDEAVFNLAELLRESAALFVTAHEYAHILLGHLKANHAGLRSVHGRPQSRLWDEELAADQLAFDLVNTILTARRLVPPARFMGVEFFFLCMMLVELAFDALRTGRSVSFEDYIKLTSPSLDTTHPIPSLRMRHLITWQEAKFPVDVYCGMQYHGAVLAEVTDRAWQAVRPLILKMHSMGEKPTAMWTGLDIFEHG